MHRSYFHSLLILPFIVITAIAEVSVTATFDPPRITQGGTAKYIVQITETSAQQLPKPESVNSLPIPQSGGLDLRYRRTSTSQQSRSINGAAEYSVTRQLIIDARASGVGRYSIPSYTFEYKGEPLEVPDATLEVVERSADAEPTADELIFLKTDAPEQLYVGQTTQLELKLYIADQVRLSSLNSFDRDADGFTVSDLPDSTESSEIFDGRRYRVLTWPLSITPIRTGTQNLDFEFTLTASLPGQNDRSSSLGRRGFGSSIFDDFFGRRERFTVYTEPTQVEVLNLPEADQPDSFSGAIGDFSLQVYTDRQSTKAGEPVMLSVEVAGRGNFDRINGPQLPDSPDWRHYAPESKFLPRSETETDRGTKRFDYVLIPEKAGELSIPEVSFAYFDPDEPAYVELSSPTINISVSPSDRPLPSREGPPDAEATAPQAPALLRQMSTEEALLKLDYQPGSNSRSFANPLRTVGFWIVQVALAALLTAAVYWLLRRRRAAEDPAYATWLAARRDLRSTRKAAQAATQADAFYASAQKAVRLALTCRTKRAYQTAQFAELSAAMAACGLGESEMEACRQLFQEADAHRFSARADQGDLDAAKNQLERILKAL